MDPVTFFMGGLAALLVLEVAYMANGVAERHLRIKAARQRLSRPA